MEKVAALRSKRLFSARFSQSYKPVFSNWVLLVPEKGLVFHGHNLVSRHWAHRTFARENHWGYPYGLVATNFDPHLPGPGQPLANFRDALSPEK